MKLRLSLLLVLALYFPVLVIAQFSCGFDEVHRKALQADTIYRKHVEELENFISERILANKNLEQIPGSIGSTALYTVPVVVHVIHTGDPIGSIYNPTDAQIQGAIDHLNEVYNGSYPGTQGVGDMQIQFQLAVRDPYCNPTSGIVRVDGSSIIDYVDYGVRASSTTGASQIDVKSLSRWSNSDYYNIWVVNKFDGNDGTSGTYVGGFAYFPGAHPVLDGTILLATQMAAGKKTLPHEIGHAFALHHPFRGSSGSTCISETDCATQGDLVCDTDPIIQPPGFACRTGTNACTSTPYNINTENNYMNYTNCYNLFTLGQKQRMLAAAAGIYRRSLFTSSALVPTNIIYPYINPVNASCSPATSEDGMNSEAAGILNVQINGKDNYSGVPWVDTGYLDQTPYCIRLSELVQGNTYTLSLTVLAVNYHQLRAWIDFNGDGVFDNASEQVLFNSFFNAGSTPTISGTFTVPANATANTVLRFRVIDDLVPGYGPPLVPITSACHAPAYGQVEDYPIYIQEAVALPGSLKSFTGVRNGTSVRLKWQMSGEHTVQNFEVEKSTNGRSFTEIGTVAANSAEDFEYSFVDPNLSNINFYRLRLIGSDHNVKYSHVVAVRSDVPATPEIIVTNPFADDIDLKMHAGAKYLKVQLLNPNGNTVADRVFYNVAGTIRWNLPQNLPPGFYVLKMFTENGNLTRKLIKR